MKPDELADRLQAGSAALVAAISPPAPDAIRTRGDRRRRRKAVMSALLALAIGAGGSGGAYVSFDVPGARRAPVTGAAAIPPPARPGIVAVTSKGELVVLNSVTGEGTRILVASGVTADGVAVSPGGSTVYFSVRAGCGHEIESVPVTGGRPTAITSGMLPAVSPDGAELALARQPYRGGPDSGADPAACRVPGSTGADFTVVVRDLASGREMAYPASPRAASALPAPISHLSWAPNGRKLLVSAGPSRDNKGWDLVEMDPATSRYYLPSGNTAGSGVSVGDIAGPDPADSYYREGVFLPDGQLFVNQVCCSGEPVRDTSSLLWEIDSAGRLYRQVAIGFTNRDHSSLDADPAGYWLLYLSGQDLFVSQDGTAPFILTPGLIAAAWL